MYLFTENALWKFPKAVLELFCLFHQIKSTEDFDMIPRTHVRYLGYLSVEIGINLFGVTELLR